MFYIYPEKEIRMKDTWGYHLLLDCTNGDKELISSKDNVYKFIKELVVAIDMVALANHGLNVLPLMIFLSLVFHSVR